MSSDKGIARNTAVVGFFTGISRLLGFARDIVMASVFGTTLASSAFALAWRLPNLFRAVLGEGALSAAFIPIISETLEEGGREKADKAASSIFAMVGAALVCIVAVGVLLLTALGRFDLGERWNSAISLSRITLPYVLFICLAALCMGVFHTRRRFLVPAISQSLLNIVWIIALVAFCPRFGATPMEQIYAVAWGVLVAGVAQLVFQIGFLLKMGFRFDFRAGLKCPKATKFLKLMAPVFLGTGVTQVNVYMSGLLAMWAGTWAPAAFTFAERLIYAALGPLGTALGTVLLPTYSQQIARDKPEEMLLTLSKSIKTIVLLMTPIAAALYALALPGVAFIYERGEFSAESSLLVSRALKVMAPGLVVFGVYKVVLPAFYAMQNTRTPVKVGVCATGISLVLNILSVAFLPDGFQHMGLAASVVLSTLFSTSLLLVILTKKAGGEKHLKVGWGIASTLVSGGIMAVVCARIYDLLSVSGPFAGLDQSKILQAAALALTFTAGLVVYFGTRFLVSPKDTLLTLRSISGLLAKRRRGFATKD